MASNDLQLPRFSFFLIARLAGAVFKKLFCNQTRNRPNEKSCSRRIRRLRREKVLFAALHELDQED